MYSYQNQFNAMLDALMHNQFAPSPAAAKRFKDGRIARALKALRCRNIFIAATGHYLAATSNNTFTSYTPPLGYSVIVFGCSLSSDLKPTNNAVSIIRGEIRMRPPAPLSNNYIQPQKAFAPATYSIYFPCPFILEAGDQIAIDFGFNAPESADAAVDSNEQQIVFFCVQVKDCLDSDDEIIIEQIKREVAGRDYQRKLLIPCANDVNPVQNSGQDRILLDANGIGEAATRPLSATTLVIGYSMINHENNRAALADTATQHSFTLGRPLKCPNLFWAFSPVENGINGPYYSYFRLPVPHLLRAGAQLACSALQNLNDDDPPGPGAFNLMFELITV